jgi:hypothetical protein
MSPYMKIDERIQPSLRFAPEVASLNMGSLNFALFPISERFTEFLALQPRLHTPIAVVHTGLRDLLPPHDQRSCWIVCSLFKFS